MTQTAIPLKDAYLKALAERVLIFDGAMGTSIQALNLTAEDFGGAKYLGCNDYLVISAPQHILNIHRSFLEAGADVLETDTFRSLSLTLADYDLADQTTEINLAGARLARQAADEFTVKDGKPRFVAGSMGPSGKLISTNDPEMSDITFDELAEVYREAARGLLQGGVDLLIIETSQDILELKAAVEGARRAFQDEGFAVPIQAQITMDVNGKMLLGTDITAALAILDGLGVDIIGMNCSTGPEHMRGSVQYLTEHATIPVSCIPNAGLPMNVNGEAVYPMLPGEFSDLLTDYVGKYGLRVVGGCCGTTPEHISELAQKVRALDVPVPAPEPRAELASSTQAVSIEQQPMPFIIGERLNAQGSRAVKRLLLADDYDGLLQIARDQVESGAHGLDVCVAVTERTDEAQVMEKLVKRLTLEVPVPLIIDSTEPDVIESALRTAPGRCLINSTNLESGEAKPRKIFALARKYSAAVLCLTIDEEGMAKTGQRKLEIAQRLTNLASEYDLRPQDLVFDDLTFTLATGEEAYRDSAIETIEGIRLIKEQIPGTHTSLGVSNVSFGLSPASRKVVNSVFLHHCVQAGLDMAIVNPAHIKPYGEIPENERALAEDLIFDKTETALTDLIAYFDQHAEDASDAQGKADPFEGLSPSERLTQRILRRVKNGVEDDIEAVFDENPETPRGQTAVNILNTVLLPAMKEVGDRFGAGELILPFVLQSAEVMKKSVAYLENFLEKQEGVSKGKIVVATVFGDVHDIGKNLVKTILSNNGYEVVDLGKQVPAETIISAAIENKADAIGLSALLVSTSKQMPHIVNELQRRQLKFPVLVGGAAINPRFGWRILQADDGNFYEPGVFYCKDAFEGLAVMDAIAEPEAYKSLLEDTHRKAEHELGVNAKRESRATRTSVKRLNPAEFIPEVKQWSVRVVRDIPLQAVGQHLNLNELYRLSWGAKNTRGEAWEKLTKEFDERRVKMLAMAERENLLRPQGIYGLWPARADEEALLVYDPETLSDPEPKVLERFEFPRQVGGEGLSLLDYYLPVTDPRFDVVAFQIVTVGRKASERTAELDRAGEFTESYYLHGLSVQMAEATADYLHEHVRRELGLAKEQGLRYSWGYPAIPEISDHRKVFNLLPAEQELGLGLTSAYQIVPEQSTAAIIVHHPEARYFNVGVNRVDQLLG